MAITLNPALFPDRVYLRPLWESADGDAGTIETRLAIGAGLPCLIRSSRSARGGFAGDEEIGLTVVDLAFPSDPGVAKGDTLVWGDRRIRAVAPAFIRDQFGLHVVSGEIRD